MFHQHNLQLNYYYDPVERPTIEILFSENRSTKNLCYPDLLFYIYDISPFSVHSPLAENKMCMTTNIGTVVTKLRELFLLNTAVL